MGWREEPARGGLSCREGRSSEKREVEGGTGKAGGGRGREDSWVKDPTLLRRPMVLDGRGPTDERRSTIRE